jgi:anaerobic selenocysteine-containing dehydrogenase
VFGAGGGTSSYREAEDADLIVMWGSNAREAHPIFFHHVLKGLRKGARMYVVDPRRTTSAQWADAWLGIDVGSDISLANAIGREIIEAGLVNEAFVDRATTGFDAYAAAVKPYTLERAERDTGVPAELIQRLAHGPTGHRSAGPSASPSTITRPTTCSRSSTWPCSPGTWAGTDPGWSPSGARTTCRAAATWGRSPTS